MRIGFDAKRAFMNASGLGNYSRTLIHSLLTAYPAHDYFAFTPDVKINFEPDRKKLHVIQPKSLWSRAFPSLWRSALVSSDIRREKLDVYHGLSNELPRGIGLSSVKVATIHDLIFLRYPQWYSAVDRKIYEKKFSHACNEADVIVAVSKQTRKDIMEYFGTPENKIRVVYQSCADLFYPETNSHALLDFRRKKNLPDPFILYVGTIEPRKNLLAVVKAMTRLKGISLVAIGKKKKYFEEVSQYIQQNNLQSRVFFPDNVPADDLPSYYRSSLALVYPSYYEGFGIPVIEALWSGTPVIASDASALPEAGGPTSLYFNPDDTDALAEHLKNLLTDHPLREKMIRNGYDYVQQFHQKETASAMMDIYTTFSRK